MRLADCIFALLCVAPVLGCNAPVPPQPPAQPVAEVWPTTGWSGATPESEGIDSNVLAEAVETIRARHVPVHSLLLERNGSVVLDAYFFPFRKDEMHDVASVTKSVISTLVGIAVRDHQLGALDQPVSVLLPAENLSRDAGRNGITLANLLSMTSGLDCRSPPGVNLLDQMEQSSDWVAFTWNLPQTWAPGTTFAYCAGNMHIVSAVLSAETGEPAAALAKRELFAPLGITDVRWAADLYGNSHGFADLELKPRDAAKLGYLWLHYGRWAGTPIVPAEYLRAALTGHAVVQSGIQYGYGFWLYPSHTPYDFEANGRGGQRITVIPPESAVVVETGGGADANAIAPYISAAIRPGGPLPPDPAGDARLAAAVVAAAAPPVGFAGKAIPAWAAALSDVTYVISDNPLKLRTIRFSFSNSAEASVRLGFASGAYEDDVIGLDGVPRLTLDAGSGHRVAMTGSWRANALDLDYNTIARIDDYLLHIAPSPNGLAIHLTDRDGPANAMLNAAPEAGAPQ